MPRRNLKMSSGKTISAQIDKYLSNNADSTLHEAFQALARQRGVSVTAIKARYYREKRQARKPKKVHGNRILSDQQELAILCFILAFAMASLPLTKIKVLAVVNDLWQENLTSKWLKGFYKRHGKYLSYRKAQAIQKNRLAPQLIDEVDRWITVHRDYYSAWHFPDFARFNVDETRLIGVQNKGQIFGAKRGKQNTQEAKSTPLGTLVPFVSANGRVFMSFYVTKGAVGEEDVTVFKEVLPDGSETEDKGAWSRRTCLWPRRFATTATGFTNKVLWKDIMTQFGEEWKRQNPSVHACVYLDNCRSHRQNSEELLTDPWIFELMSKYNVHVFFFPPNVTHFLQPLDDVAFGAFQKRFNAIFEELCFSVALHEGTDALMDLSTAYKSEVTALTPDNIKKSWSNTGMICCNDSSQPDYAKIRANCGRSFGILATEEEESVHTMSSDLVRKLIMTTRKRTVREKTEVTVKANQSYSLDQMRNLVEHTKKENAEKEQAKKDKEAAKEQKKKEKELTAAQKKEAARARKIERARKKLEEKELYDLQHICQACQAKKGSRKVWKLCPHCERFSVCDKCLGSAQAFFDHLEACPNRPVSSGTRKRTKRPRKE